MTRGLLNLIHIPSPSPSWHEGVPTKTKNTRSIFSIFYLFNGLQCIIASHRPSNSAPKLFHWASARSLYVGSNKTSVLNTAKMIVVESIVWVNRVRKIVNSRGRGLLNLIHIPSPSPSWHEGVPTKTKNTRSIFSIFYLFNGLQCIIASHRPSNSAPKLFHWASARSLYVGSNKTSVLNTAKMIVVESIVWVNRVRKIVNCKHGPGKKTVIFFFVAGVSLKKTWILFFFKHWT